MLKERMFYMYIEKSYLASTLEELENALKGYTLPLWDSLPDIELYMDQVISLITKYMEIYGTVTGQMRVITPSMINNYVKLGIIPAPVKKKYSKIHLSYLLIICTLKQTLDISTIQRIIPVDLSEEEVKHTYNSFVLNQRKAFSYVTDSIKTVAEPIINLEGDNPDRINDLVMQVSASANIFKILTQKVTKLPEERIN
mgnify:CR=1 FL=1